MAVAEDRVDREAIGQAGQQRRRVARDADVPSQAVGLELEQRRERLLGDLVLVTELHVVELIQVDVVDAQAIEAGMTVGDHRVVGEVEAGVGVPSDPATLGGEEHLVAERRHGCAESSLGQSSPVVGRRVEVGDAAVEGVPHDVAGRVIIHVAVLVAQSGRTEPHRRDHDPVATERHAFEVAALTHRCSGRRAPAPHRRLRRWRSHTHFAHSSNHPGAAGGDGPFDVGPAHH